MGSTVQLAASLLFSLLLSSICGIPAVGAQDPREGDALCNEHGCYVVYFQRKSFLDAWKACKQDGGNLVTIKRQEEADEVAALFSDVDLRHSRATVRVWIGLQRQPRQCKHLRPLRGYSWTTGDQDTQYTNWLKEDSPNACVATRCVVMGYSRSLLEMANNFKWLDGSCTVPADGYLCRYTYEGMCPPVWSEGGGNALYATPFNVPSTTLTHLPVGTVATLPCPLGIKDEQSVSCMSKGDGIVGWSRNAPLCYDPPVPTQNWCEQDNGGCEHFCRMAGEEYYCKCTDGFQLADDGQSCEMVDVCHGAPCEFECLPLPDGYRCACPEGYMLAPDEESCVDVDECLQSPCEQLCVNSPGTFECSCRQGYHSGKEGECEDVDECMDVPCEQECENTEGAHICHCHIGFSVSPEDPSRCLETDECQIPGTCEQMCVNYVGGFECYCEEGYELRADHFSCQKVEGGEGQPTAPPFPWVTYQPDTMWNPDFFPWPPEQSQTDWPNGDGDPLDWLTDPPQIQSSDMIWVTSAPQEERTLASDTNSQGPKGDEWDVGQQQEQVPDWLEWDDNKVKPGLVALTTPQTTPSTTSLTPIPDPYEDDYETITDVSTLPMSTSASEGAWNWLWVSPTPAGLKPGITAPEEPVTDHKLSLIDYYSFLDSSVSPAQAESELEEKEKFTTAPPSTSSPRPSSVSGGKKASDSSLEHNAETQSSTWLLVGLLVPICIFVVAMVALGIVYCTRGAAQPRNKNTSNCYHWISGAHDKQGVHGTSAGGVKSHV